METQCNLQQNPTSAKLDRALNPPSFFKKKVFDVELNHFFEHYKDKPLRAVLEDELNLHMEFLQLLTLSQQLCHHKFKAPFQKRKHYRRDVLGISDLGQSLVRFLSNHFHALKDAFHQHQLNPQLQAVLQICEAALSETGALIEGVGFIPALPIEPDSLKFLDVEHIDKVVQSFNDLALVLRRTLAAKGMRAAVKSFRRNATERYKQLMAVGKRAWGIHSDILLIRLDWGSLKTFPAKRINLIPQDEFETQALAVDKARRAMLRQLQAQLGHDLAFYAWKIECGDVKGLHVHWLIGINGAKHQDRVNVPRMIAERWKATVGDERNYTFNVNGMDGTEAAGLRVLSYRDPQLWEVMGRYADYLSKPDYNVKLRLPKGMRSFGCSQLRPAKNSKTGPKRRFQMPNFDPLAVRGPQGGHKHSGPPAPLEGAET